MEEAALYGLAVITTLAVYGSLFPGERQRRKKQQSRGSAALPAAIAPALPAATTQSLELPAPLAQPIETQHLETQPLKTQPQALEQVLPEASPALTAETPASASIPADADRTDADRTATVVEQPEATQLLAASADSDRSAKLSTKLSEIELPEVPLAVSLSISEVVHPSEQPDPAIEIDYATEQGSEFHPAKSAVPDIEIPHSLQRELEEMEESDRHDRQIAHLAHYVNHPDSVTRAAVAWSLGELATQSKGKDLQEIIFTLNQLRQDVSADVRFRAAVALGAIRQG